MYLTVYSIIQVNTVIINLCMCTYTKGTHAGVPLVYVDIVSSHPVTWQFSM